MRKNDFIPAHVLVSLVPLLGDDFVVRLVVRSDLSGDYRFEEGWVLATATHLIATRGTAVTAFLPLASIQEARVDELFGCSRLVAVLAQGERRLAYYTLGLAEDFGAFCREFNALLRGDCAGVGEPSCVAELNCSHCGAPLPEKGVGCARCVGVSRIGWRLLAWLAPYRGRALLVMAMTVVAVLAQMVPPLVSRYLVDDVVRDGQGDLLPWYVGALLLAGICYLLARLIAGTQAGWVAARVIADLRSALNSHLQRLPVSYFNRREEGEILSRVMHDTQELQSFLIEGLPQLLVNVLTCFGIAGILWLLDWRLAMVVFLPVPVILLGVRWFWRRLVPLFNKSASRTGGLFAQVGESIRGIRAVKSARDEKGRARLFDRTNTGQFTTRVSIENHFIAFCEVSLWLMSLGVAGVWWLAGSRVLSGEAVLSPGTLLAFICYLGLFYAPLQWFTVLLHWMSHAFSGAERIFALLDVPAESGPALVSDRPVARTRGHIVFDRVRFSYEGGREVLRGLSLEIRPGEMIGLVGKSGAGKSTIINLLCRFFDPDAGRITLDGVALDRVALETLRGQIGLVLQEPFLFRASILENIRYGQPEASFEQVLAAARAANAHDFIIDKEEGYDTILGEGGERLSGGEKQRIAIARALLSDPPILVLDEATSSVDSETERAIQEAITTLVKGRTTIAIAHRLGTLRNADRLAVIEEGKLAELGTHEQLLALDGLYAGLVKSQVELSRLRGVCLAA